MGRHNNCWCQFEFSTGVVVRNHFNIVLYTNYTKRPKISSILIDEEHWSHFKNGQCEIY